VQLTYIDDMPPTLQNEDDDENGVHEDGLNEIMTCLFGDGKNYEGDDSMDDSNYDIEGNYHQRNVDYINLNDSIKKAMMISTFKLGASRT
jgi:hypothetical protein